MEIGHTGQNQLPPAIQNLYMPVRFRKRLRKRGDPPFLIYDQIGIFSYLQLSSFICKNKVSPQGKPLHLQFPLRLRQKFVFRNEKTLVRSLRYLLSLIENSKRKDQLPPIDLR